MADEQETGFTFVDKRGSEGSGSEGSGGESAVAGPADSADASTTQSDQSTPPSPFQLPHLKATDRILMSLNLLGEGAWIALGLVRDPATDKIEQDLPGARTLIDCIAEIASKVEPSLDEGTQRELKTLVRDLQLNFVQQQSRSGNT